MSTSLVSLRTHYGLRPPFNFNVAIPFLLNAALSLAILSIAIYLLTRKELLIGTERFYFLCYIAILCLTAALLSRLTYISLIAFLWCATELSLALISNELEKLGVAESVFPRNVFASSMDPRFEYHPTLGLVPKPNYRGEWHIDRRNLLVAEYNGGLLNPSFFSDNFVSHNSLGLRGRELSANDLNRELIFAYGGSTTYDYNVTQGLTWTEKLEYELNNRFTILNFGVIAHTTTQNLISTAFYQSIVHKPPVCAIYFVGVNDLYNSHVPDLDPMYAKYLSLSMLQVVRKPEMWAAKYSPLFRLANRAATRRFNSVPEIRDARSVTRTADNDYRLERLFAEHIITITAINTSRRIKTVFVAQMWNMELLTALFDGPKNIHFNIRNEAIWPLQQRLNSIMERTAASTGAKYIDPGVENFNNSDFADLFHFSAAGSAKFARLISKEVESYCEPI